MLSKIKSFSIVYLILVLSAKFEDTNSSPAATKIVKTTTTTTTTTTISLSQYDIQLHRGINFKRN